MTTLDKFIFVNLFPPPAEGSYVFKSFLPLLTPRFPQIHTPQVISIPTLLRGFDKVENEGLEVTDDASVVEHLGEKVKLTEGEYTNLKITTPEDLEVAASILRERGE